MKDQIYRDLKDLLCRVGKLIDSYNEKLYQSPEKQLDIHKEIDELLERIGVLVKNLYC